MLAGVLALLLTTGAQAASLRVCVYHDAGDDGDGRLHGILLANLLGHFKEADALLRPAQDYVAGALGACDRAAYIGTRWSAALPKTFLREAAAYPRPFLWLNYGVEALQNELGPEAFMAKTGFIFRKVRDFDGPPGPDGVPGFFRDIDYKGATFTKKVRVTPEGRRRGSGELTVVDVADASVLAVARHSARPETAAYATRKGGFFYVADDPFLYTHERDRYLIVADLLFDFLGLPPRERARPAVVRLEDVHPEYDLRLFYRAVKALKSRGVPFAVSVIPVFVPKGGAEAEGRPMTQRRAFLRALRYAQASGGTLLMHGYTHHVADEPGCPSLGSGADYEFWDRCRKAPLAYDSERFTRRRLEAGLGLFKEAGLQAVAWVTPHYAASPADSRLFGKLFARTLQRVTYFPDGPSASTAAYANQFFPYTVYRDHYGQFVWPEDLGFVPMPGADWGYDTPEDIGESVRRTAVVRDAWASFFWHPQLAASDGGLAKLEDTIDAIRSRGFTFVSLKERLERGE